MFKAKFSAAKEFSDFIGFHVRVQFLLIAAFISIAPFAQGLNDTLRCNLESFKPLGLIELGALVGLVSYSFVLFFFALREGSAYVFKSLHFKPNRFVSWITAALSIFVILIFILLEFLIMGTVAIAGIDRIAEAWGVDMSEINTLNDQLWERACLATDEECLESSYQPLIRPEYEKYCKDVGAVN